MLAATRPTALRALPPMAAAIMLLCAPGYAETLDELSRILKITDGVMRHLAVRRPQRKTTPATTESAAPAEAA